VARRQECTPRPRDWEYRTAGSFYDVRQGAGEDVANATPTDPELAWVHVRLDAEGRVTDARVERGPRRGSWEQRVLNYVRTMEFVPATEDGQPVPGETTIPVRLSMAQ
jgi:TonB family protein